MSEFIETDEGQFSFLDDSSKEDFPSEIDIPEDVSGSDNMDEEQLEGQISFIEDDIQETEQNLTESDKKWLDEQDEVRSTWEVGEVPHDVIDDNIENSTHNKDAESITLGKYPEYIEKAGDDSSIYNSDRYDDIQDSYQQSDEEMYEHGNRQFVENSLDEGKDVYFTSDPSKAEGTTGKEVENVQEKTGFTDDDIVKFTDDDGDDKWYLKNEGTYTATDSVYAKDEKFDKEWN